MNTSIKLRSVVLRVKDINKMKTFYQTTIGLALIEEHDNYVSLGVDGKAIVELVTDEKTKQVDQPYAGLYHLAILVPDEVYLGQLLYHFHNQNYNITGAGDHDYSQALYMNDPEGNGIEIYADRPRSEWTIYDDGTIKAVTESVNIDHLLNIGKEPWQGMPKGTRLGHVHLQVNNIKDVRSFFVDMLAYDVKTDMGHALFISKEGYHHDFGLNVWQGPLQPKPELMTGLEKVVLYATDLDELESILVKHGASYERNSDQTLTINDKNDIVLEFRML